MTSVSSVYLSEVRYSSRRPALRLPENPASRRIPHQRALRHPADVDYVVVSVRTVNISWCLSPFPIGIPSRRSVIILGLILSHRRANQRAGQRPSTSANGGAFTVARSGTANERTGRCASEGPEARSLSGGRFTRSEAHG